MKRKILWLGVSFLLVAALVLTGCPATPGVEEPVVEEPEEVVEVPTLSIGETYQTPEVAVTVSEVIVTDSYEYYDEASGSMLSKEASPGTSFLIATIDIENVGDTMRPAEGQRRFHIFDAEGNKYLHQVYFGEDSLSTIHRFPAGEKMEGKVLFNIPEGAGGLTIEYWRVVEMPLKKLAAWVIE